MKHTLTQAIDLLKRGEAQIMLDGNVQNLFDIINSDDLIWYSNTELEKYLVFSDGTYFFRENPVSDLPIIKLSDIVEEETQEEFKNGELVEVSSADAIWSLANYIGLSKTKAFVVEHENGAILKYGYCRKPIGTITKEEAERILNEKIID